MDVLNNVFNTLIMLGIFGTVYMLPTILAFCRHLSNRWSVTLINALLGWTLIGWVGTLAWAVAGTAKTEAPAIPPPPVLI